MAQSELTKIHAGEFRPDTGDADVIVWDNVNLPGALSLMVTTGALRQGKVTLNAAQVRTLRDRLDLFLGEQEEVGGEDAHLEMAYEDRFTSDD